jgi:hypothetical protein
MEDDYYLEMQWGGKSHRFRFGGGPLSHPNVAPAALEAYGFTAACWARLETHIEAVTLFLNRQEHSNSTLNLHQPRHPSSTWDKIKLVRKYFNRHPALRTHKANADRVCERLLQMALDRNELLHSIVEDYANGHVTINGIFVKPDTTSSIKRSIVPLPNFGALARQINDVNAELSKLSQFLFAPQTSARLRMP